MPVLRIAISRTAAVLLAAGLLALGPAATASAGTTHKILEACGESRIPTGYSQQAYEQALKHMPPELAEYSECPQLISKAERAAAAGSHGGGGASGGAGGVAAAIAPATPAEQRTLEHITHSGAPVKVGGEVIHPGVVHVDIASALANLPTPLLALLAFLAACALLILGQTLRARVRGRNRDV